MQDPIINWFINKDEGQAPIKDDFLGNVKPGERLTMSFDIWNNRFGQEDVSSANNCKIRIQAGKIENSFLLNKMTASIDGESVDISIINDISVISSQKRLTGLDITYNDAERASNRMNLILNFDIPNNIQESLKDLIIDLSYEVER